MAANSTRGLRQQARPWSRAFSPAPTIAVRSIPRIVRPLRGGVKELVRDRATSYHRRMRVTIDHIAVMCADLERSLRFYRDLLGFEVVSPEEHDGGPIDQMVRIDGVYMREYRLRPPGGVNGYTRDESAAGQITLDLIQWVRPESPVQRYPIHHVPSAHICLGNREPARGVRAAQGAGGRVRVPPGPLQRRRRVARAVLLRPGRQPAGVQRDRAPAGRTRTPTTGTGRGHSIRPPEMANGVADYLGVSITEGESEVGPKRRRCQQSGRRSASAGELVASVVTRRSAP